MTKRDVVFLVADAAMEQMVTGFLGRPQFHQSLRCGEFRFDPREDMFVHPGREPGVYRGARDFLRLFEHLHQRAVVMLDAAWDGSPGADAISKDLTDELAAAWDQCAVIVIDPELEAWVWQENPHVAQALRCRADVRAVLADSGHWPLDQAKPADPKAALEHLCRHQRADGSRAAFRRLAEQISVRHCTDPAFLQLRDALRTWFPETS